MPYDPSLLTPLPDIDQYIDDMAAKYRLDRNFFRANLYAESGENIDIGDSPKGAVGIGQIMPSTFEGIKKALPHLKSVRDPYDNVEASAYYLDQMLGIFDGDYDLAIAAYNAGPEAVKKYGGIPPFAETQKHVEKVRNKALGMASKSAAPQPPVQPVQPVSRVAREVATPWYRKPGYMITAPFTGVGEAIGNLMKGIAVENELAKKHYGPILEEALKYSPGGPTKAPPVEPPELNPLYKAGQYVAGTTGDVPTGVANSYTYQILKQLGYTGTQIALVLGARGLGRLIGPTEAANLGLLTAVGQPVLSEQAEMYERGRKQGASMDVALDAASEAAHLGLLDTLGVLGVLGTTKAILGHAGAKVLPETTSNVFRWVVNRVSTLSAKYPRTLSGVLSAIEEAMTEIPQGYLEDNIAIKHFNEVVDRYNNAKDAGIIAGGAGGIMGFILAALGIRLKSGKWRLDEKKGETEPDIKIPKPEERIILTEEMVEPTAPATPAEPAPQTVPPTQEVPATTPTTSGEPKAGGRWSEQLAVLDKLVDYAEDRLYKNAARKEYPTEARAKAAARMYSDLGLTVQPVKVGDKWKLVRPGGPEQTAESQLSGPHSVQALNTVEAAPAAAMPTEQQPVAGQSPAAQQTPAAKKRTTRVEKLLAANRQTLAMLEEKLGPLPVEGQPVVGEQPATAEQPVAEQPPAVSKKQAGPEPKYMKYVRALQEGATLERNAVLSTGEAVHPRQLVKMQEDGVIDFNPETQRFELTPGYRTEKSVEGVVAPDYEEFRKRLEEKQAAKSEPAPVPVQTVELVIEETKKSGKLSKADRRRAIAEAANRRKSRTESGGTTLYSFNPLHIPIFAKLIGKFMGDIKNTSGIDKIRPVARFAEDDATFLAKHWKQSWWYVKDKPELKAVLDTSLNRLTDSTNNLEESLKSMDAYRVLSKDKRRLVDRILVALDGMPYNEMGITEDHVLVEDRTLRLNDVFYRQYEDYIQQVVEANYKGEPTEIVKAITEIRRGLDKDRLMLLNTATRSQRYSDNMLNDIWAEAMIPNYFPHTRYGEMVVEGHILNEKGKWTKVYDTAIDMSLLLEFIPRGMSEKAFLKHAQNVLIPRLLKDPAIAELGIPEDGWVVKRRDNLQLHQYENHPMLIAMLNEVVERAVEHVEDPSLKFAIESVLPVAIRDAMKKGNWGHFAHRKNIPGYETRNVGKVLYDYKAGLYNLLAKAEAARRYGDLIKNIKGVNRRKWAVTFIGDDLSPMSKVDKAVATIRLLAYAKYMGMSLKNPIVNLSNMVNQGSPVLAMDVGPVADKYLVKAIKKIAARRHTPLDPMRERLLKELFTAGIIQSQYVKEVKSDLGTRPGYDRIADTVLRIVTLPMELTEVASRACTALAAYDAMVDGKIKNKKKLEELGIKKGQKFLQPTEAEYQKLKKFAETVVLDSHSLYGRASKPSFARTGVVGKTIAGAYIFTHFAQHVMHLYGYMMRQMIGGNMNAGYALVRSLAGTVAFGGAMAIPLAATLSAIYRKWFPKELRVVGDDPLQTLASKLPPGWDDVAQYGLPALGGITVGTSLALELPDALEDFFGVPVSMMKDIYTAKKAWSYGDGMRALEAIVPIKLLRDYLTARRLVNEGMTTVTGKPIGPGPGPAKLTNPLEIAGKIAGFQPVSMQKIRDIANMRMDLEEYVNAEKTRLSAMYVRALRNNDNQALEGVLDEWHEWNNFWLERHKTEYVISLREAIREKQRVERPPRRMRRMFMDIEKKRGLSNY